MVNIIIYFTGEYKFVYTISSSIRRKLFNAGQKKRFDL